MQVFRTESDFPRDVQIVGVGVLLSRGQNAIDVERAALNMTELSEKDDEGQLVKDEQGGAVPLAGKALDTAAKEWVDKMEGIEVATMSEAAIKKMTAAEITADDAQAAAEAYAAQISPVALSKEQLVAGTLEAKDLTPEGAEEIEDAASPSATDGGEE